MGLFTQRLLTVGIDTGSGQQEVGQARDLNHIAGSEAHRLTKQLIGKIELTYVTDGQLEISIAQQVEDLDSEDEGLQESYTRNSSTLEVTKRF